MPEISSEKMFKVGCSKISTFLLQAQIQVMQMLQIYVLSLNWVKFRDLFTLENELFLIERHLYHQVRRL